MPKCGRRGWHAHSNRDRAAPPPGVQVERTKARPLASGAIAPFQALVFLGSQLSVGLAVLLSLNWYTCVRAAATLRLHHTLAHDSLFTQDQAGRCLSGAGGGVPADEARDALATGILRPHLQLGCVRLRTPHVCRQPTC